LKVWASGTASQVKRADELLIQEDRRLAGAEGAAALRVTPMIKNPNAKARQKPRESKFMIMVLRSGADRQKLTLA
jgi:hypothetical protein